MKIGAWLPRAVLVGLFGGVLVAGTLQAGIGGLGRTGQNQDQGPYKLPALKRLTEVLNLNHDQSQAILAIYNTFKHREHEEMQNKTADPKGRDECIAAMKKVLTEDQIKKFENLLSDEGKKKKK
jgi:hypothetical protein